MQNAETFTSQSLPFCLLPSAFCPLPFAIHPILTNKFPIPNSQPLSLST
ncbi:MAG: hypothetical protein F6K41_12800 [Symploca sp. SIO3E6]|nr:hypothetical protein [Caldora sp. SIO3E6]